MGLFDFFKKKTEDYDPTNLSVRDLDVGFVFDYNLKTWVVKEAYAYDWGDNNFSNEFKIDSGDEQAFLSVEEDNELILSLTKPIKIHKIDEDVADEIEKTDKAPRKIRYEGEKFYLDSDSAGYFHDKSKGDDDWEEMIEWEYFNDEEDKVISIIQWDERTFEAAFGKVLKEFEISNILPGES